jgi:excisionase family DNA binding protein
MQMEEAMKKQCVKRETILSAARRQPGGDSLCLTFSVEQAARALGISLSAAYAHARDGSLPTIRLGKRFLVPKKALERLLLGDQPTAT